MLIDYKGILINLRKGYADIYSPLPQECTTCHRMTSFFVNENGESDCTDCATKKGHKP